MDICILFCFSNKIKLTYLIRTVKRNEDIKIVALLRRCI